MGTAGARELFLINLHSGEETRLTDNEHSDVFPKISPDGKRIVFTREGDTWIMERDGSSPRQVMPGTQVSFSPAGERLVLVTGRFGRQITVADTDGSDRRDVFSENTTVSHPVFIRHGSAVLFLEEPDGRGVGYITIVALDESRTAPVRITTTE